MKQLSLFEFKSKTSHGGKINFGRRKCARPLDKNRIQHVVMRSQHAKGERSFRNFKLKVELENLIRDKAQRYGIRIAELSNVGNHFHILIRFQNRQLLKTFFKVTMGLIARLVTKAQKGKPFGRFWDGIVFTRIVSKGRDEARMRDYLYANKIEAEEGGYSRNRFESETKKFWRGRQKTRRSHTMEFGS